MTDTIDLQAILDDLGPGLAEAVAERDAQATFAAENYTALKKRKVFSAMVPSKLGGGGASHSQMCAFLRGLGRYCSSTALSLSMHQHLIAAAVFNYRNGKPGRKLLEKVAAKELVLISTGANDWLGSNGEVAKVDGGYRVSARKPFASGSPFGDILITSAPYEDPDQGWQVLHFPVPMTAEGSPWPAIGRPSACARPAPKPWRSTVSSCPRRRWF